MKEEDVLVTPEAKALIAKIGMETSLRYAMHMIMSASLIATKRHKTTTSPSVVDVPDVSRAYTLFADVKRSTQHMVEFAQEYVFNEASTVPPSTSV
jgi:RuvB-like protein 2